MTDFLNIFTIHIVFFKPRPFLDQLVF